MTEYVQYAVSTEWHGERMDKAVKEGGRAGVRKAGEYLKSLAVPLAPLDLGPLRESASVKLINAEPVAYLIFDTPYAAVQHEREDYQHDDGQAKYVETPMVAKQATMQGIIAKEVAIAILRA